MKLKRILGLMSAFAGIGIFSVCAYAGTMTVEDVTGAAGGTVEVNVYISPSEDSTAETLNAFTMNLAYDSDVLTPVDTGETDTLGAALYAAAADSISSGIFQAGIAEAGKLTVSWADADYITYSEKTLLFTVEFTIDADTTESSSSVSLTVTSLATDSSTLADSDTLAAYAAEGTVTIGDSSFLRGDANGDDEVTIEDAARIAQYRAGLTTIPD